MSLRVVHKRGELRSAQQRLVDDLTTQLPALGRKWVTFRPTSAELDIYGSGAGRLYFGARTINEDTKFWNAFGIFNPMRPKQEIAVEINFALDGSRTAGFFAVDATGRRFLMHTGGIGGGKAGISQTTFIAWLQPELVAVEEEDGTVRHGIVIGELEATTLATRVESFVRQVRAFKDAVADGLLEDPGFQSRAQQWGDYFKEFSGRKTGSVNANLDYVSYHGDVVEALKLWLEAKVSAGDTVTNSRLIDLLVHSNGQLRQVCEVKTSVGRQSLYTGIGQLVVHGSGQSVGRQLVLPLNGKVPNDVAAALQQAGIDLLRFRINADDSVAIVGQ